MVAYYLTATGAYALRLRPWESATGQAVAGGWPGGELGQRGVRTHLSEPLSQRGLWPRARAKL